MHEMVLPTSCYSVCVCVKLVSLFWKSLLLIVKAYSRRRCEASADVNELQAAHLLVSCLCAANLHAVRCRELLVRLQRGRTGEVEGTDDAEKASVVTTCIKHFNERHGSMLSVYSRSPLCRSFSSCR